MSHEGWPSLWEKPYSLVSGGSSPIHDGSKNWKNNIEYSYNKTINIIYFYTFFKLSTKIRLKMCNVSIYMRASPAVLSM
jgi:hypothetical protein